jgi:hypothetical protein
MDMEINQYIDDKFLPTKDLSYDECETLIKPIKDKIKQGKEDGSLSPEEIQALIKSLPMRGIFIKDYENLKILL